MSDLEKEYKCKICWKLFNRKRFLRRHLIIRHKIEIYRKDGSQILYRKPFGKIVRGSAEARMTVKSDKKGIFTCTTCSAQYDSKIKLWNHRSRHNEKNYVICEVEGCGYRMFKRDRAHHFRQIHTFETQLCEICTRTFRNYECLRRHKYKVHDTYKCKGCGKQVYYKTASEHECPKTRKQRPEYQRNFKCDICGSLYTLACILRRHMKHKHQTFEVRDDHQKDDTPDVLICSTCGESFESKELYNRHKRICTCILCTVCSAPFNTPEKLEQHMTRHAEEKGERKFKCDQCTCRFSDPRILASHIQKRHTNNEMEVGMNFECHLCEYMFRKSRLLKIHLESRHNMFMDNLDSVCVICFKNCGMELPKHMKMEHKKTFVCQFEKCGKKYRTSDSLTAHEKIHEEGFVPDYTCSVCLVEFPNQKALVQHFKLHAVNREGDKPVKTRKRKVKPENYEDSD